MTSILQVMRYSTVGVISNVSAYLVYLMITSFGVEPKEAATLLYFVAASVGFIGHRKWSFSHKGKLRHTGMRYVVAHFFGCLINIMLLWGFVDILGYDHRFVQVIAIFVVATYLFVVFKFVVFVESPVVVRDG